jgi:hypothetical protein
MVTARTGIVLLIAFASLAAAADEEAKPAEETWVKLVTDVVDEDGSLREYNGVIATSELADLEHGDSGRRFVHLHRSFWLNDVNFVETQASGDEGMDDAVSVRADTVIAIYRLQPDYIEQVILPQMEAGAAGKGDKDAKPEKPPAREHF